MTMQYPVDGRPGKDYRVTSPFGWRTHPTSGKKSHHNGVDIWADGTVYNEAIWPGVVVFAGPSKSRKADGSLGGFGYHVMVRHIIDKKPYISVYAHMVEGSLKVKVGDRVRAGAILGKMGATGDVTGKHLHFELYQGRKYTWSANGKNFVDPMEFIKAHIAKAKVMASIKKETPENAPVAPVAVHGPEKTAIVEPAKPKGGMLAP